MAKFKTNWKLDSQCFTSSWYSTLLTVQRSLWNGAKFQINTQLQKQCLNHTILILKSLLYPHGKIHETADKNSWLLNISIMYPGSKFHPHQITLVCFYSFPFSLNASDIEIMLEFVPPPPPHFITYAISMLPYIKFQEFTRPAWGGETYWFIIYDIGRTALDFARQRNRTACVQVLEARLKSPGRLLFLSHQKIKKIFIDNNFYHELLKKGQYSWVCPDIHSISFSGISPVI